MALGLAPLAAAAAAEPVIVDPDPADPEVDWELRLETVLPSGLASPSAIAFFGQRIDEEFLVLEEDTGIVRHFVQRVEQPIALDLAVDNCGERGLVDIGLHPAFDSTPTPVTDPPTPRDPDQDWVYLSYHPRGSDGCDLPPLNTVLRVERFKWDIATQTLVPDPLVAPDPDPEDEFEPFVPFEKAIPDGVTTAVRRSARGRRLLVRAEACRTAPGQDDAGDARQSASSRRRRRCTYWNPNRPFTHRCPLVTE